MIRVERGWVLVGSGRWRCPTYQLLGSWRKCTPQRPPCNFLVIPVQRQGDDLIWRAGAIPSTTQFTNNRGWSGGKSPCVNKNSITIHVYKTHHTYMHTYRQTDNRQTDKQTDGRTDGQTDRGPDGQTATQPARQEGRKADRRHA